MHKNICIWAQLSRHINIYEVKSGRILHALAHVNVFPGITNWVWARKSLENWIARNLISYPFFESPKLIVSSWSGIGKPSNPENRATDTCSCSQPKERTICFWEFFRFLHCWASKKSRVSSSRTMEDDIASETGKRGHDIEGKQVRMLNWCPVSKARYQFICFVYHLARTSISELYA